MNNSLVRRFIVAAAAIPVLATLAACNIETQEMPSVVGPSEFGSSLTLSATPDAVNRDGISKSVVTVTVRDSEGRPVSGQQILLAVVPGDGGKISNSSVVSGPDGRATVEFTAPESTTPLTSVSIQATPVGQNYANAVPRSMVIGLIGPDGPMPVTPGVLVPRIVFSPTDPYPGTEIHFDGRSSQSSGVPIVEYWWDYGDGETGHGEIATHSYSAAYTYTVRLTVRDSLGRTATTTTEVKINKPEEQP